MPSKVNKICNKIVKNFIPLLSVPSFFSFAPYMFTLEPNVCSAERTQNAAWDIVVFFPPRAKLFSFCYHVVTEVLMG